MKNFTIVKGLFILVFILFGSGLFAVGDPANVAGTGTAEDPFLIGSVADLKEIGNGGDETNFKWKYYKFIADIDFAGADQQTLWHTKGFAGYIDGNGFSIKNVRMTGQTWLQAHLGVFWNFQGTIKNLGFVNVTCNGDFKPWDAIDNPAVNQGIITNLLMKNSQVENCWAIGCNINGTTGNYAGGLFGVVQDTVVTTITNCFADVTITGVATSGGIAGENGGVISKTAFYGSLPSTGSYSIALNVGVGTVSDSYYKTEAAPENVTAGSTAIAAADLTSESSYPAFDFVSRPGWTIGDNYAIIKLTDEVVSNVYYENVGTKNDPRNPDTYINLDGLIIYPPLDSTGYVFEGWYRDMGMTDKVIDTVAILADPLAVGDVTFYAKWVALAVYNIIYENMEGVSPNNPATFQNDTAVTLNDVIDFKGDSVFIGWYMDAALTIPVNTPAIAVGAVSDQTFYSKWKYRPFLAGGDGSAENPFQVATVYDLQNLEFYGGWHNFVLINDIDMDGENYTPVGNLSGTFDGGNHVVTNLTINGKGFVSQLSGTIKNFGLEGLKVSGAGGVGGLVGALWDGTAEQPRLIENCYIIGDTITGTGSGVGGLVGYCWTLSVTIRNCFVDAVVIGPNEVGGLFGRTSLKDASGLEKCAFYGLIETTGADYGAIMGLRHGSSIDGQELANSFYYIDDVSSTTAQGGSVGIAWDDLSLESSYPALDFSSTWKIAMLDEETEKECAILTWAGPVVNTAPVVDLAFADSTIVINTTVNLSATVTDDGYPNPPASLTYSWSVKTGDASKVTISSSDQLSTDVTISATGTYVLEFSANDGEAVTSKDVTLTVTNGTGISNVMAPSMKLYPNPASTQVNLEMTGLDRETTVRIIDMTGKLVYTTDTYESTLQIDVSDFNAGFYFVSISSGEKYVIEKLNILK